MQWQEKKTKKVSAAQKSSLVKYPEIIANLLSNRGILTKAQQEEFFNPKEKDLHDPYKIPDMKEAVKRIMRAKENGEKVAVYGDYDVDGVCASYILWDFLYRQVGIEVIPFIPSRFTEGYGLNKETISELGKNGVKLIITVDCGIKDSELVRSFNGNKENKNIDFIITDHHTPPEKEDFASIAVHPGRKDSKYPFKEISGTTVAWKLIHALVKELGKYDYYKYIEFVALATVCDVMPLTGENRTIVKLGLQAMQKTKNLGLKSLIREAGIEGEELGAYHCGFVIGPRINAAGRLVDAIEVVRLFATESPGRAAEIASNLSKLNTQRQELTFETLSEAMMQAEEQSEADQKLIFTVGENWHEGVIGLVAGKLSEKYHRPSICATIINGKVTASARSISTFNITEAISVHADYLSRFGGHAQAAGFSLDQKELKVFKQALQNLASKQITKEDLEILIQYDQKFKNENIDFALLDWLQQFEPFGLGNPRPTFYFENLTVVNTREIGKEKKHVKLILLNEAGQKFEAIHFNAAERYRDVSLGDKIDIIASIEKNTWNGRMNLQLKIKDIQETLPKGI